MHVCSVSILSKSSLEMPAVRGGFWGSARRLVVVRISPSPPTPAPILAVMPAAVTMLVSSIWECSKQALKDRPTSRDVGIVSLSTCLILVSLGLSPPCRSRISALL